MLSALLFSLGIAHASDSAIGRRIHLQNARSFPKHLFFLTPPEAVEKTAAGYPRFSADSKLKLSGGYSGDIEIFSYSKDLMTAESLFRTQDLWLDLTSQIKSIVDAAKNRELEPSAKRENAERLRILETELQQVRFQLDEAIRKGVPEGAIACQFDFSPSFLQGGSGINVIETVNVKSLNDKECILEGLSRQKPLPDQVRNELATKSKPVEELGCGCSSASPGKTWMLLPLLALVAIRRGGRPHGC